LEQIRKIAKAHPRYGYRRIWAILKRQGTRVNRKRIHRVWKKAGLSLPRRRPKKRVRNGSNLPLQALYPNHVWTYDFIFDETADGRKLKFLTVVDEYTRESPGIRVGRRMSAAAVKTAIEELFEKQGPPEYLRSDNGPEFIAKLIQDWLASLGTKPYYIKPGSPWENPYGESFNDKFRVECLDMEIFLSVPEARVVSQMWHRHYNQDRPHSSLGYKTPAEYRAEWERTQKVRFLPPAPSSLRSALGAGGRKETTICLADSV